MAAPKKTKSKNSKSVKSAETIQDEALDAVQNAPKKKNTSSKKSSGQKTSAKNASAKKPSKKSTKRTAARKSHPAFIWCRFAAAAILVLAVAFILLFDVSRVTSNAMMPTLARNDLVISWAPVWGNIDAAPGTVLLIDNSKSESAPNYLRLIANQSEEISFHSDKITINGTPIDRLLLTNNAIVRPDTEPEIWRETLQNGAKYHIMLPRHAVLGQLTGSIRAQNGAFLAGDNRMASYDSRQNGLFEPQKLRGRALFILESSRNDGIISNWFKSID